MATSKNIKPNSLKKDFDLDFDKIRIDLPGQEYIEELISEQLLLNKDLPADILFKMSMCAAKYARWSMIQSDLISFKSKLEDEFGVRMSKWKMKARNAITDKKPSESRLEEASILNNKKDYMEFKRKSRKVNDFIEKIKRIMKAFEIQSEMARSLASYIRKEMDLTDNDPVIKSNGSFSKTKSKVK